MSKPYYRNKKVVPAEEYNKLVLEVEKQKFNRVCKAILLELIKENIFKLNDLYNINHLQCVLQEQDMYVDDLKDIKERLFNGK